jgi:hypothetical protein
MRPWKTILITAVLITCFVLAARSRAQEPEPWRFGVIEAYTAPNAAREMQASWTRVTFQWADVQREGPESWTPPLSDEQIDAQIKDGREVVGLLIGIPDWARDEQRLPSGLWLEHDDPANTWANYVREAAGRYAGRIDHWIIWNEPDIDATAVAHTWDGSVDDFYQLQRVAYLVAKESNPDAVIHLAAFTYWADVNADREQYMARLLDRILQDPQAASHDYYFDVATAHLYFQADQIYDLLRFFRGLLVERGLDKPIWLVETNAPPYNDPGWPVAEVTLAVTENEQAAFMPQALAAALAAGAERVGVYKLRDTEDDRLANPEPFGLLRRDGSRRLAYATLKVAMEQMRGVHSAARLRWDEIGQFELQQEDRRTTVLFARLPDNQIADVTAVAGSARLINMWGEESLIEAENGRYQIDLQSALCTQTIGDYCMIGGTTLYLVEALDGGPPPDGTAPELPPSAFEPLPIATPTPLPTATRTPPPTLSPTSLPTAANTAAASPTWTPGPRATEAPLHRPTAVPSPTLVPIVEEARADQRPAVATGGFVLLAILGLGGAIYWRKRSTNRPA